MLHANMNYCENVRAYLTFQIHVRIEDAALNVMHIDSTALLGFRPNAAFHLGLHCLPNYHFLDSQYNHSCSFFKNHRMLHANMNYCEMSDLT